MEQQETREQVATRRRHAEAELIRRGVLKRGFPPGLQIAMALFPGLKSPYHGDHGKYAVFYGVFFGMLFVLVLGWLFHADGRFPAWIGVALGVAAGAGFGIVLSAWQRSVGRRLKLTPWQQLDKPASKKTPEGAEDYETVEGELFRKVRRFN